MRLGIALCAGVVLLFAACGDDDGPPATVTPQPTGTGPSAEELCTLLSPGDIEEITGQTATEFEPYDSGTIDRICTISLDEAGCGADCTLALNNLGAPLVSTGSTSEVFRQGFIDVNVDAEVTFTDDVVGAESWLATTNGGAVSGWKLLYFQSGGVAFALASPHKADFSLSEEQMISLVQVILANLGTPGA